MKNNYSFSIQLLLQVLKLIGDYNETYSIFTLSQKIKQPTLAVRFMLNSFARHRSDIRLILGNTEWCSIYEEDLLNGFYDNEIISLSSFSDYLIVNSELFNSLCLSTQLSNINETVDYITVSEKILLEDKASHYNSLIEKINNHLHSGCKISCKTKDDTEIRPFGIYYYEEQSEFYAIASNPSDKSIISFFPFTDLIYIKNYIEESVTEKEKIMVRLIHDYLWSPCDVKRTQKPVEHVLLIMNEPNTQKKIIYETSRFSPECIKNKDGTLIIRFSVFESSEFFSWILSYGSSLIVLSPDTSRQYIINEYKKIFKE